MLWRQCRQNRVFDLLLSLKSQPNKLLAVDNTIPMLRCFILQLSILALVLEFIIAGSADLNPYNLNFLLHVALHG